MTHKLPLGWRRKHALEAGKVQDVGLATARDKQVAEEIADTLVKRARRWHAEDEAVVAAGKSILGEYALSQHNSNRRSTHNAHETADIRCDPCAQVQ